MAGKTREIKGRIKAVANIQRITKTMQMIATAKFQSALKRATAAKPYTEKIAELVTEVARAQAGEVSHPMLRQPAGDPSKRRELLLVITSNRGLCGAYNANVLREASAFLATRDSQLVDVEVVGKKGVAFFKFAGQSVSKVHAEIPGEPGYEHVEPLAARFMDQFIDGTYDAVHVAYMAFESVARQKPVVSTLMPLEGVGVDETDGTTAPSAAYEFSPDPQELLDELLPATVKARLFQAFNEAVVSEQIARMVAMKAATDAAGKMGKNLKRDYNRARQAAITTELSEIIAGASALG